MAGLGQVLHRPAAFLSSRTFFTWRRWKSFRSTVWFLTWSYLRRRSFRSSGVWVGILGFLACGFLGFGLETFLGFASGLVSLKLWWKVILLEDDRGPNRSLGSISRTTRYTPVFTRAGLGPGYLGHLFPPNPVAGSTGRLPPAGTARCDDASPPRCGFRTRPAPRRSYQSRILSQCASGSVNGGGKVGHWGDGMVDHRRGGSWLYMRGRRQHQRL